MARPPMIQKLAHGRLLTGRAFRWFVETWNWLTAYVDNMRGDYDVNAKTGFISIDRTNPDVPVLRFRADRLPQISGYSTEEPQKLITGISWDPSAHRLVIESVSETVVNGVITAREPNENEYIETTSISEIQ